MKNKRSALKQQNRNRCKVNKSHERNTKLVIYGEIIMQDGKFTRVNAEEYINAIQRYPTCIGQKAAKEFFEIDGTNAHFMREGKL